MLSALRKPRVWMPLLVGLAVLTTATSCHLAGDGADTALLATLDGSAPGDWTMHGRTYGEDRFSPLTDISENNVGKLGLAWSFKIDPDRALQATPLVVDGVMYVTGPFSIVYALDATTGAELWTYDPQVDRGMANRGCCGPSNRGVAYQDGRIFFAAYDGRLISLDAKTGKMVWSVDTIVDHQRDYTISGAPRLAGKNVVIGNGGSEYGVRGYVTAFDRQTGKQIWRFFTVPGSPKDPGNATKAMQIARPTWFGNAFFEQGGGGTAWDSMVYDPALNLLYIGVGNAAFWSRKERSQGKGDNLFVSSIVAVDPDTGDYRWHYQETPGDEWDFTATQHMILADLRIEGRIRKVLMQAPKNGFFYVLDRETGKLISAKNYVPVTWAKGIDMKTGRPIVDEAAARYEDGKPRLVQPGSLGGHNWHPMSFDPVSGLVFIPAMVNAIYFQPLPGASPRERGVMNVGLAATMGKAGAKGPVGEFPNVSTATASRDLTDSWEGRLIAWDPVKQKAAWTVRLPSSWNGGTLATAGKLVFQGNSNGELVAYRTTDGKALWRSPTNTGVVAPPISYSVKGEQYVAVAAGWGGAMPMAYGPVAQYARTHTEARILVFKIGGTQKLPAPVSKRGPLQPMVWNGDTAMAARGGTNFAIRCGVCHGFDAVSGGELPDLRYMSGETSANFAPIVKGAYASMGMPSFKGVLNDRQIEEIRQYLAMRNGDLRAEMKASGSSSAATSGRQ